MSTKDYESDFEEYNSNSQTSDISDTSVLSIDLEHIQMHTHEKETIINSVNIPKVKEESLLDSGHYELEETKKRAAMVETLMANHLKLLLPVPEIKHMIDRSYREEKQFENKSLPSSTDEGFEDVHSNDFAKIPSILQIALTDFKNLKKKSIFKKSLTTMLNRGQALMNMIKLDTVEWSLYESKPISYDEFIKTYGKLNTEQVSTQTNEDTLDVKIQTDKNEFENKWTQFPIKCRNKLKTPEDMRLFKMEFLGVGGDKSNCKLITKLYDVLKLNEFLSKAGKIMLALLEEKESRGHILQNETNEFPFSEGCIKLSVTSLPFLYGRQVTILYYSEINNKILMSIHAAINMNTDPSNKEEYIMNCCIGCVWNVNEPSKPIKLFYTQSPITTCCFHCANNNIIFAGLQDGSICLWDLQEEKMYHQTIVDKINEMNWIIRSPTYTTAGNWEIKTHMSTIVAIKILYQVEDETENLNNKFVSIQICSLDEDGQLIIWSVLHNLNFNCNDNSLSQWGKVKLVKQQKISLLNKKNGFDNINKDFIDMNNDSIDNLYLATNDTKILCVNCIGTKNNIPFYELNEMDSCGNAACIEVCPFKQSYFFVGCKDGSIRLHSLNIKTPILKLKEEICSIGIKCVQWSKSKSLMIYVLDNYFRIIIWNLSDNDIYPSHIVSTKTCGPVKCMRLSHCHTNRDILNQYLALGTKAGNVEIHKLKKNFCSSQQDDFLQEMKIFLKYVSIL